MNELKDQGPRELFARRRWLRQQQENLRAAPRGLYFMNDLTAVFHEVIYEQETADARIRSLLLSLYRKLPVCRECQKTATHQLGAEFLCDAHASGLSNAVEVGWAKEVRELGSD